MQHLYQIALTTHLVGITTMAGSTLVSYVLLNRFWHLQVSKNAAAIPLLDATVKLNRLFAVGILLLIISGVTMMYLTRGVYGEQVWFRLKFGLIITVILNGLLVGRRQGIKLTRTIGVSPSGMVSESELEKMKRTMMLYYIVQIVLFVLIYTLSVFKFN
jgi:hypothetical protein